jgi:glycosyltransferase involved in cell wall biosynthesis
MRRGLAAYQRMNWKVSFAMRVCHIWPNFYPIEFGGVERYILGLSDFLSQQDQSTRFVMITDKATYVPLSRALRISSCQRINSLEVHRLRPNFSSFLRGASYKLLHRTSKPLDNMLTANLYREAASIRGIDKVDIFHVHGFWQPLYPTIGLLLSQHLHRPFVVTLHGDSVNVNDHYRMPMRDPATIDVLRRASAITTFSKETINILQELGLGGKSRLIPNFIDTRLFKRPISYGNGSGNRIVMVTRFSKPKDPMTPIRAFAKVRKEVPEATFKIVGYGPLYEEATSLVQNLNLAGAVTMVGMKLDVRKFLWDSDIFIGTRGSYITTLEAWAAGLAVLAPEFGIMKELVSHGENGFLAPPGDADQLASEIIGLIKNKNLRTKIAANGVLASEKHDIRNVAPIIANIYKSLQ